MSRRGTGDSDRDWHTRTGIEGVNCWVLCNVFLNKPKAINVFAPAHYRRGTLLYVGAYIRGNVCLCSSGEEGGERGGGKKGRGSGNERGNRRGRGWGDGKRECVFSCAE